MASSSSAAAAPPPWVILGRIVALERQGALEEDHGSLSVAALEQQDAAEDPGHLSVALAVPRRLRVPTGNHIIAAKDAEDLSAALAVPRRLRVSTGNHIIAAKDAEDLSAALAVPRRLRVSTGNQIIAAKGLSAKPNISDTDMHPFVIAFVDPSDLSAPIAVPRRRRVSAFTVPTSSDPESSHDGAGKHPYVVAADDAGLLLHVSRFNSNGKEPQGILFVARNFEAERDTATGTTTRVPDPPGLSNVENIGLLSLPGSGGADFIIAELRLVYDDRATLLTFRSGTEAWVKRDLRCPSARGRRGMWSSHDVIAHDGKVWWVSLEEGLLYCDPFANEPVLRHAKLPSTFDDSRKFASLRNCNIERSRMVRVSQGKLRCVDIARGVGDAVGETSVIIHSLEFSPGGETRWEQQSINTLRMIWASESYKKSEMPMDVPVPALLHPSDPDIVYFFIEHYLFSINLAEARVVDIHKRPCHPPISWHYVLAWELPSTIENQMGVLAKSGVLIKNLVAMSSPAADESDVTVGEFACSEEVTATNEERSMTQAREAAARGRQSRSRLGCVVCQREHHGNICGRCVAQVKLELLDVDKTHMKAGRDGFLSYCLNCHKVVKENHIAHQDHCIPLDWYKGALVAWVTGKENWAAIFHGIQSDICYRPSICRPFLLHRPHGSRCTVCKDMLSLEVGNLYDCLTSFCTIKCWMERAGAGPADEALLAADAMMTVEFNHATDAICLTCTRAFKCSDENNAHSEHDWLPVVTESGRRPRVQIASGHHLARVWWDIKGAIPGKTWDILIKDETCPRCQTCQMRLVDGGGRACSLRCNLPQPHLLPRPLHLQQQQQQLDD